MEECEEETLDAEKENKEAYERRERGQEREQMVEESEEEMLDVGKENKVALNSRG